MAKKGAAKRAWKLLKLALVWAIARKGGVFRRGLAPGLRLVPSFLGSLRAAAAARPSDAISYGEREFSFDETPVFHFKVHRPRSMRLPHIPCINPPVADDDVDYDGIFFGRDERESWLRWDDGGAISTTKRRGEEEGRDAVVGGGAGHPPCGSSGSEISGEGATVEEGGAEEKSIDMEADEFIAKFYEQMRLQRQISLLQYNEMLARSTG